MASGDSFRKAHDPVLPDEQEEELKESAQDGSGDIGGTAPDPEADDDVDEVYKETFGNEPRDKTIGEEINEDEKARREK